MLRSSSYSRPRDSHALIIPSATIAMPTYVSNHEQTTHGRAAGVVPSPREQQVAGHPFFFPHPTPVQMDAACMIDLVDLQCVQCTNTNRTEGVHWSLCLTPAQILLMYISRVVSGRFHLPVPRCDGCDGAAHEPSRSTRNNYLSAGSFQLRCQARGSVEVNCIGGTLPQGRSLDRLPASVPR